MTNEPIITSLLDTDNYKYSMLAVYFERFANCTAQFVFRDRKNQLPATQEICDEINRQLDYLCQLKFTKEELDYLFDIRYLKPKKGLREFLKNFQLDRNNIHCAITDRKVENAVPPMSTWQLTPGDEIIIYTSEESILATTLFEIPVLSIVNEVYTSLLKKDMFDLEQTKHDTIETWRYVLMPFMEFGTRRRFSKEYQYNLVKELSHLDNFIGTSNVFLAKEFGITPTGTMAHEYIMLGQALENVPLAYSQKHMFREWLQVFDGDLGYALSDTLGTDKFLKDFSRLDAMSFTGCRHDSGCPFEWTRRIIDMYKNYGINPLSKTVVYSDGVDIALATRLANEFKGQIQTVAGVGTSLTNPFCPTNFVMKPVVMNGKPVAKVSEDSGKTMCRDAGYVEYLKQAISGRYE